MFLSAVALLCSLSVGASLHVAPRMPSVLNLRPVVSRRRLGEVHAGRKGRPRMPGGPAGAMPQQQMVREPEYSPDGTPVFYLYCRNPKSRVMWYPISSMRGDGQSKALIAAWLNAPIGKGVMRSRLDEGMARSIFESERRLSSMARKQYPSLKNIRELEWGYKVLDRDVAAKEAAGELEAEALTESGKLKIFKVEKEMVKDSILDQAKKMFGL